MKKTIFAAMCCIALLASCTEGFESTIDMTTTQPKTEQTGVNRAYWDADEAMKVDLMWISRDLIVSHCEIDYFRAVLNEEQLDAIDFVSAEEFTDLDMAVSIIHAWWINDECFEVLCEDSKWDSFKEIVLQLDEYRDLFPYDYE
jgi:hypothetical protein